MLADILKRDIRQYAAQGVEFTPCDIVRLNALAVRVKLVQHPCMGVHLPRACYLPATSAWGKELVLREPTIAHELWLEQAANWIDTSKGLNYLYLHAYALSIIDADDLPDAFDARGVVRRVLKFAAKRLARYTRRMLADAVDYVLFGADWTTGEDPVSSTAPSTSPRGEGADPESPTLGLICRARAMRLPISLEDAHHMTASELAEAVCAVFVKSEDFDPAVVRNHALGDYVRTRNAIVRRIKQEQEGAAK